MFSIGYWEIWPGPRARIELRNKATMCNGINRYVNYVPIAKVKGWRGWNYEPGTMEQ